MGVKTTIKRSFVAFGHQKVPIKNSSKANMFTITKGRFHEKLIKIRPEYADAIEKGFGLESVFWQAEERRSDLIDLL